MHYIHFYYYFDDNFGSTSKNLDWFVIFITFNLSETLVVIAN